MAYMTDEEGNYKRTVTCGHCYEKGHNKASCKELRQTLRDRIAKNKAALEKDAWTYDWEKESAQSRLQAASRQLYKLEGKGKTRKCGYCSDTGHTRRTCQERKDHVETHTDKTLRFRRELCDRFISRGLGPGALVEVDTREWTNDRGPERMALAVVTSIDFSEIQERHKYDGGQWFSNFPRNIKISLVKPVKSSWNDNVIEHITDFPNVDLLNVDDHEVHAEYSRRDRGLKGVASPVVCGRDMMGFKATDKKTVEKWVLNNIVDPK
tara:strand:- start:969 stop:1766 length:798 start_codon:yes stop_codon:yes gene_type:complete